ncbi:MAG: pantoate--beta-alanine ligase, partial [Gammaproteobacteria bacterium]
MQTLHTIASLRQQTGGWREKGRQIAFVPTMGNLHRGHMALVERGRQIADRLVVSIFVNPLQFGPGEDYARYPRTLEQDALQLAEAGVDLLFAPSAEEMYPQGKRHTQVVVPGLSDILCGASRPGHFQGVATVVAKLFNLVQPHVALFGEKDYQQLLIIRHMVRDLGMPVEVMSMPTVREADGLALSSRNSYLTPEERRTAPFLYRTLLALGHRLKKGERDYRDMEQEGEQALKEKGFRPEYV